VIHEQDNTYKINSNKEVLNVFI